MSKPPDKLSQIERHKAIEKFIEKERPTTYTITVSEASKKRSLTHHIETWLWDWSYNKRTGKTLEWLLESLKRSCCVRTYPDDWESKVPPHSQILYSPGEGCPLG